MHAQDKFVAFIDVLGFSALVEARERDGGDFSRPLELMEALEHAASASNVNAHGPTTCPKSRYLARDLNFQVTQVSDCVVVSAEVSPAGIVNLVHHCFGIAIALFKKGALCRGSITRGSVYHKDGKLIGSGYERAFRAEKTVSFRGASAEEMGTPFIQIEDIVINYVRDATDDCVRKIVGRMTRSDGTYSAIYPFSAFARLPSAIVRRDFDPNYWKGEVRRSIAYREADLIAFNNAEQEAEDESAKQKIRHYKRGLEEAIQALVGKEAALDRMLATGQIPYGSVW